MQNIIGLTLIHPNDLGVVSKWERDDSYYSSYYYDKFIYFLNDRFIILSIEIDNGVYDITKTGRIFKLESIQAKKGEIYLYKNKKILERRSRPTSEKAARYVLDSYFLKSLNILNSELDYENHKIIIRKLIDGEPV